MATKVEHIILESKHALNIINHVPEVIAGMCPETVQKLINRGLMQVSTIFEHATAHIRNTTVVGEDQMDLGDGAECKLTSVRTSSYGTSYSAPVRSISGKTGDLLVQVYERKLDKFYYFVFPYSTYCHIKKSSNIEIPFNLDGTPRPATHRGTNTWWKYQVESFNDLSK
jgi:hypothetical protein